MIKPPPNVTQTAARFLSALALAGIALLQPARLTAQSVEPPAPLTTSVFSRADLIYGSEIGAYDQDGGTATNVSLARQNVISGKGARVIRYSVWDVPYTTQAQWDQFVATIDQIRHLGAIPIIKLPPIYATQVPYASLSWIEQIIQHAGSSVQLYELFNEPDSAYFGNMTGTTYANTYWNPWVPAMKAYARSLGWEIYVGGPALTTAFKSKMQNQAGGWFYDWMNAVKTYYNTGGLTTQQKADLIPNFASVHCYPNYSIDTTQQARWDRINVATDAYGNWTSNIATLRTTINSIWGSPIGPSIDIAVSEYCAFSGSSTTAQADAADQTFCNTYMSRMIDMMRNDNVWFGCLFTIASNADPNPLHQLSPTDGSARPLYNAYTARSLTDSLNNQNAYGGAYGVKVVLPATANFGALYQTRQAVTPNTTYTVSMRIKGSGSVLMEVVNPSWTTVLGSAQCTAGSNWTQYSFNINSGSNTSLTFVLQDQYNGAGTAYIDEVFMGLPGGDNILDNYGFEYGDTGWEHKSTGVQFSILQNP